jgi:hypothetical protein
MDYKIYNIIYQDNQKERCEFDIYKNTVSTLEDKSYLFEYNPILDIMSKDKEAEYVGIFSWKFIDKTGFFKKKLDYLMEENPNYDVYTICPPYADIVSAGYYKFTENYHPGFMDLFKKLCNDLNLDSREPKNIICSNFLIVKWDLYKEFIEKIIKPAIELLETKYVEQVWKDAKYCGPERAGLTPDKLREFTGLEYYPFHTFILERLWSAYLQSRSDIKVINLAKIKL